MDNREYAGFWIRVGATIIDTILMMIIIYPILLLIYGKAYFDSDTLFFGFWDLVFNYVLPAFAVILFWIYQSATPGKMLFEISIVDADTGAKPGTRQLIGRYFAYYLSALPFCLGLIWVGLDKRKQGWHDKLASTVVIKNSSRNSPV